MKLIIQQHEAIMLAGSFARLHKHCVSKQLARKEQLRLLMADKSIMLELSAGAIREALEKLNEVIATAPDSNGNYVVLAPRKTVCALRDLVQGRLRLLNTQVIPAYDDRVQRAETAQGAERLARYLTTAKERAAALEKLEIKCLKALK